MAGADGWNEERREKPEYEQWVEANRKLQNLMQQPLEAKQCHLFLQIADPVPYTETAGDGLILLKFLESYVGVQT
jgi:hypothetical protein